MQISSHNISTSSNNTSIISPYIDPWRCSSCGQVYPANSIHVCQNQIYPWQPNVYDITWTQIGEPVDTEITLIDELVKAVEKLHELQDSFVDEADGKEARNRVLRYVMDRTGEDFK